MVNMGQSVSRGGIIMSKNLNSYLMVMYTICELDHCGPPLKKDGMFLNFFPFVIYIYFVCVSMRVKALYYTSVDPAGTAMGWPASRVVCQPLIQSLALARSCTV